MSECKRKVCWMVLLSLCHCAFAETTEASTETKEVLSVAEAKDRLDIVKTIKKINDDGSYTIGYEADDGSFKIESRDILGNIKGTYGYVDDGGELKRVSYTSRNISEVLPEAPSVVQRIPKTNPSTKPPSVLIYNPTTVSAHTSTSKRVVTTTSPTTVSGPTRFIHFPQRSLLKTTLPPQVQKSEGQISRPEISTVLPEKPVTEEPAEIKESNLLRRQLPQEHLVHHFQQGFGEDAVDVYTGSQTSQPLFTTTNRPRVLSTPFIKPGKPTTETPVKENVISEATSVDPAPPQHPVGVYHVQQASPPLVAVRHPYHGGIVLMPYSQINPQPQYFIPNPQYVRPYVPNPTQYPENPQTAAPVYIQRPPLLRSIPLPINENAYDGHEDALRVHAAPRNGIGEVATEVDGIKPPVSTRDFQKILELLILRQARLEQVNALLFAQLNRPTPSPGYLVRRPTALPQHPRYIVRPVQQDNSLEYSSTASSYTPTRRVARLLRSKPTDEQHQDEESNYLPPPVREMLLLKMLQLAINPALPMQTPAEEEQNAATPQPRYAKKTGIRNVQVLGEEEDEENQSRSTSRYK